MAEAYKNFHCKICLEVGQEPVITPCGHLYCWACLLKVTTYLSIGSGLRPKETLLFALTATLA
jgi:hypothetical protein